MFSHLLWKLIKSGCIGISGRMVVDHSDADDILQDVFVKAWTKFDSFEGRSQLFTWLYKIATNQCLEFLKKKKRKAMFTFTDVDNEMSQKLTADNYFDGNEAELKLQQAILTLPEKQRLVFNMKYFDEMKYDDMSSVLGTSVGALKASYHQAVKKIEKFVTQE